MTILQESTQFIDSVVPKDAPAIQRQEMRRAFLCGYASAFKKAMEIAERPEELAEDQLEALFLELAHIGESLDMGVL
jgi:hypothetical protein